MMRWWRLGKARGGSARAVRPGLLAVPRPMSAEDAERLRARWLELASSTPPPATLRQPDDCPHDRWLDITEVFAVDRTELCRDCSTIRTVPR